MIFDVERDWPMGVVNSIVTLRISGGRFKAAPQVEQAFDGTPGGFQSHNQTTEVAADGDDWLVTMQLAPHRTVTLR